MTFLQIVNSIKDTAYAQPNVNTVVREFLDLNREDVVYSAVVIQDRDGERDIVNNQDYITYTFHLGYVDRLRDDQANRDDIFSTGMEVLNNIVNQLRDSFFPYMEVSVVDRFNTFNQRFIADCAGVYIVLAVNIPISDCVDTATGDIYDSFSVNITENGVYHYVPSGRAVDEIDIEVNVPGGGKEEETLDRIITENGSNHYIPEEGKVFRDVHITTDVHPSSSLSVSYTQNGVYNINGEFNGGSVTVNVSGGGDVENMKIYYTSSDGNIIAPYLSDFGANIVSNTYENGSGVIIFDGDVTRFGQKVFYQKNLLTSITIPDSVIYIDSDSFYECSGLVSITIPKNAYIDPSAFSYCSGITSLSVAAENTKYTSVGNSILTSYAGENQSLLVVGCKNSTITNSVKRIGDWAFTGKGLTTINLGNNIEKIGDYAFDHAGLTSLVLPNSLKILGRQAFFYNYLLTTVTIPESVMVLDNHCFGFCLSLEEVIINSSVPAYCGNGVFANTSANLVIRVPAGSVNTYKNAPGWSVYADKIISQ